MTAGIDVLIAHAPWRLAVAGVEDVCRRAGEEALARAGGTNARGGLCVLLCDDDTARSLNRDYRGADRPTNVLSFPFESPAAGPAFAHLGDVAIAYETVTAEAAVARRTVADHLTHLVVHGVLHLLGYGHDVIDEAEAMEALEVAILDRLGVADPYGEEPARQA